MERLSIDIFLSNSLKVNDKLSIIPKLKIFSESLSKPALLILAKFQPSTNLSTFGDEPHSKFLEQKLLLENLAKA